MRTRRFPHVEPPTSLPQTSLTDGSGRGKGATHRRPEPHGGHTCPTRFPGAGDTTRTPVPRGSSHTGTWAGSSPPLPSALPTRVSDDRRVTARHTGLLGEKDRRASLRILVNGVQLLHGDGTVVDGRVDGEGLAPPVVDVTTEVGAPTDVDRVPVEGPAVPVHTRPVVDRDDGVSEVLGVTPQPRAVAPIDHSRGRHLTPQGAQRTGSDSETGGRGVSWTCVPFDST